MKTKLTAFASLLLSSTAFAHVNSLPHTHHGEQTNWLSGLLSVAALALVGFLGWKLLKLRDSKQR